MMNKQGLSPVAIREISRALAGLSGAEADRVAVLLEERGPLAGTLKPPWEPWEKRVPQTRGEVEALVIAMFDQHVLDNVDEESPEFVEIAMLVEAVADVQR